MSNMNDPKGGRYVLRFGENGRIHVIRLKTGSDLLLTLDKLINEKGINAAVILSGVGLLSTAKLRNCKNLPENFPITDKNRNYQAINYPCEILSISGNVSTVDDKALIHAHLTLSYMHNKTIKVIGGHLIPGCIIHGFSEIIIMEITNIEMIKKYDEETKTYQLFS